MILHVAPNGRERPIAYASRTLSSSERVLVLGSLRLALIIYKHSRCDMSG